MTSPTQFEKFRALQAAFAGTMAQLVGWPHGMHAKLAKHDTANGKSALHLLRIICSAPSVAEQVPFTYWDNQKRVYGTDENGLGRRTFDNVGVQYGLAALGDGKLQSRNS